MIAKDSANDNISSNQMIILQSPKVIATLTIMIITTTIIIMTTKKRAITTINSIDFTKIGHHLVLHSKSATASDTFFPSFWISKLVFHFFIIELSSVISLSDISIHLYTLSIQSWWTLSYAFL